MSGRKWFSILSLLALVGITVFSVMRYYSLLDQNRILQKLVRSYDKKVNELKEDKKLKEEQLTREKAVVEEQLASLQEQLQQLNEELADAKKKTDSLEDTNAGLLVSQRELEVKVGLVTKEKEALEAKFASFDELKKAIRDLKIKMSQEKETMRQALREKQLMEGNRGYVIYQGFSTNRGRIKIEVTPVP